MSMGKPKRLIRFDGLWDKTKINFLSLGKKFNLLSNHWTYNFRFTYEENCQNFLSPLNFPFLTQNLYRFEINSPTHLLPSLSKKQKCRMEFLIKGEKEFTAITTAVRVSLILERALIDLSWYLRSFWHMRMSWNV